MKLWHVITSVLLLVFFSAGNVYAEETLKVGVKLSEPWVMYDTKLPPEQRLPRGFSIDLWNAIAGEMGAKTQWVYFDTVPELIQATQESKVNAGISAITVTNAREQQVDFSNSMYELGLQILVPADTRPNPWLVAIQEIGKLFTWQVLLAVTLLVVVFAHVRWLVDRRFSGGEPTFPEDYHSGINESLWWALTMFTTWDTPPRRGLARLVDLGWFLMGFLYLGILSSVITAALTAQNIDSSIQSAKDLLDKRVAVVATDAPKDYLLKMGVNIVPVKDLAEGMQKVISKDVDALVHDGPRLIYLANQHNKQAKEKQQVSVLPISFNPQSYGIAFPPDSPLIEPVNRALLKLRETQGVSDSIHESLRNKWLPN